MAASPEMWSFDTIREGCHTCFVIYPSVDLINELLARDGTNSVFRFDLGMSLTEFVQLMLGSLFLTLPSSCLELPWEVGRNFQYKHVARPSRDTAPKPFPFLYQYFIQRNLNIGQLYDQFALLLFS